MQDESGLSDLDTQIVEALRRNGRLPTAELARMLGASEATIRKRLTRLLDHDLLRIVAVVSTRALGYAREVQFAVRTNRGEAIAVAEKLGELEEVRFVAFGVGTYDLVVNAVFKDERDLFTFVTGPLADQRIVSYESLDILAVFKRTFDWLADRELLDDERPDRD